MTLVTESRSVNLLASVDYMLFTWNLTKDAFIYLNILNDHCLNCILNVASCEMFNILFSRNAGGGGVFE